MCTKSYDAENAIKGISDRITPETTIVLTQNGMGYQQIIADAFPNSDIIIASTTEGANKAENNRLNHAAEGTTTLGYFNRVSQNNTISPLQKQLISAGFNCIISQDIKHILWKKLVINCGINPYSAIINCPNGQILEHDFFQANLTQLTQELSLAAKISGVELSAKVCRDHIISVATATSNNISSMLQDVRHGRKTEIDYMNGYIYQLGVEHHQEFTINKQLMEQVKGLGVSLPAHKEKGIRL